MALWGKRGSKDGDDPKPADKAAGKAKDQDAGQDGDGDDEVSQAKMNKLALFAGGGLLVVMAVAIFAAFTFVESEREREIQAWQIRLGIVADSRAADVNEWIDQNFTAIRELAQNASLQVYMSTLTQGGTKKESAVISDEQPDLGSIGESEAPADAAKEGDEGLPEADEGADDGASASYLRNLLIATAERTGFKAPPPVGEITANVERVGIAGLGLVDKNGQPIVSTPDMPPRSAKINAAVAKALEGEPAIIDLFIGAGGDPTIGFVLPVFGVQDDQEGAKGIGAVVGIRIVGKDLWNRLKQPGETAKTAVSYLVRNNKGQVEYLSPLSDGTAPMKRKLSRQTKNLAAAFALGTPGGFGVKRDYAGNDVLAASRRVSQVRWVLIRKVDHDEALAETDTRLKTILGVFISMIVIVTLAILFVWKKGASFRATQALHEAQLALERFTNLSKFMQVVTNNQPNLIVAVDESTQFTFANAPVTEGTDMEPADLMGKTMASVWGPIRAQSYADVNKRVIATFDKEVADHAFGDPDIEDPDDDDRFQVIRSYHVPLRGDRDFPPAALMILSDITELTHEKRRGERMMNELIDTLITVVDRRDPFSANHSTRVAEVSCAIAGEMDLPEGDIKAVETAGKLMNFGKIFIPPDVLTKTSDLTPEERTMVAHAYLTSVDLLENVTFEGPVVETIRQLGETWDGKGPLGLKAEEILITSRILAVANTFVGMISPRAYRGAMPFRKAADILMQESDTKFDRRPVSGLINYLENRGGMRRWRHFREKPIDTDMAAE